MAIVEGGAWSVMNSYVDLDGVPVASDADLLTGVLRERLGFTGVVVADYFAVAFLELMHAVAADRGDAAVLSLTAGIDIELPAGDAYLAPLAEKVRAGALSEAYVDRAVLRALAQKEALGLLEPDAFSDDAPAVVDLDPPQHQAPARRLAERSVVLLSNDGVLPLVRSGQHLRRVAIIGPNADRAEALQGCYSFANHVLAGYPDHEIGISIPTVREALEAAFAASDVAVVVVGDQAGLFGRGTMGEGYDCESLELPRVQRQLVEAVVATGTPVVLVLVTGRPYAIGWALDGPLPRPAAVLQAFFPGEGGGLAIADILTGAVNPSGRLPVSLPRSAGAQPYTYLQPILGGPSEVTSTDPTPARPSASACRTPRSATPTSASTGRLRQAASSARPSPSPTPATSTGADVVQLYGRDLTASVVRPTAALLGYVRVDLRAGESRRVRFEVPTTRLAFTDRRMARIVEPGDVEVWVASHATASTNDLPSVGGTNGAISNTGLTVADPVPGRATERAILAVTGDVYELSVTDPRLVLATVS